jgi:hypothetical protein
MRAFGFYCSAALTWNYPRGRNSHWKASGAEKLASGGARTLNLDNIGGATLTARILSFLLILRSESCLHSLEALLHDTSTLFALQFISCEAQAKWEKAKQMMESTLALPRPQKMALFI